jgi:NADPH-dependent ferric siderophore reductase
MADLQKFRSTGLIAQSAGAAAAALKARAAEWDAPLSETPERLSLMLWGCELHLILQDQWLRVDLAGPERRLIGNLRDTATQIFAEAGLEVRWDHVDTGALAPGLSLMRVSQVRPTTPNFLRVRLTGPDAARFGTGSLHFRLLLPPAGRSPVWPRVAASGRTVWPEGPDALHRPVYTVAAQEDDWLEFDIFRHAGSPTCDWADSDPVGAEVGVLGPGGGWCPDARRLFLFGDQTALPAIVRMLRLARGEVRAVLSCAADDLGDAVTDPRVTRSDDLLDGVRKLQDLTHDDFVWFAAKADHARAARQHLLERGIPKQGFVAAAYWG